MDENAPLEYVQGRNKDLKEVIIKDGQGKTVLKFAQAYGFRNIQNIMRKIKQGKCDYDYVELMACPSGCVNGGGQVKLKEVNLKRGEDGQLPANKDLIEQVEIYLNQLDQKDFKPITNTSKEKLDRLIYEMTQLEIQDPDLAEYKGNWFEMSFKAVPKETNALQMKW